MLVLASASPRRADLLRAQGYRFTVAPTDSDETWLPGEAPADYVVRIARGKADLALPRHPGAVILAADTTVWLDATSEPLGKPSTREEAGVMLRALTGAGSHFVTTAFAVADARGATEEAVVWHEQRVTTRVWMRSLDEDEIDRYLDSNDWADRAGGYAIQGLAAGIVTAIEGSYTTIVGLPLAEVLVTLRRLHV